MGLLCRKKRPSGRDSRRTSGCQRASRAAFDHRRLVLSCPASPSVSVSWLAPAAEWKSRERKRDVRILQPPRICAKKKVAEAPPPRPEQRRNHTENCLGPTDEEAKTWLFQFACFVCGALLPLLFSSLRSTSQSRNNSPIFSSLFYCFSVSFRRVSSSEQDSSQPGSEEIFFALSLSTGFESILEDMSIGVDLRPTAFYRRRSECRVVGNFAGADLHQNCRNRAN